MRSFKSDDGLKWQVWVQDTPGASLGTGWETVLFAAVEGVQRVAHRPAGWLERASERELRKALAEAEAVRTRWGSELAPAGR